MAYSQLMQDVGEPLRLGFVPGVMPDKWAARFRSRFGEPSLELQVFAPDDVVANIVAKTVTAALAPLPVDKDTFHAIPLYTEVDDQKGRVPGRQIGLVWRKDVEHPLLEELTGIVRGRTANSSRGAAATSTGSGSLHQSQPPQKVQRQQQPGAAAKGQPRGAKSGEKQVRKSSNPGARRRRSK